jgi:hypothetical protein
MRVLATLIGSWLCLSAYPCRAEGRIHEQLAIVEPGPEPASAQSFELSLVPQLEMPEVEEPEAPLAMHEATVPPHLVMIGRSRGAMLDRCRGRMRNVSLIGHGASTDGRPDTCRLLSFVGMQKNRERAMARRAGVRTRFSSVTVEDVPELPRFAPPFASLVTSHTLYAPRASAPGRLPPAPPAAPH